VTNLGGGYIEGKPNTNTGEYDREPIRLEQVDGLTQETSMSEIYDLKMRIQALEASVFPEDIVTPSIRAEIGREGDPPTYADQRIAEAARDGEKQHFAKLRKERDAALGEMLASAGTSYEEQIAERADKAQHEIDRLGGENASLKKMNDRCELDWLAANKENERLRADNADLLMCDADVAEMANELKSMRRRYDAMCVEKLVVDDENANLKADLADTDEALEHTWESRDYWRKQAKAVADKRVTKALLQAQEANRELCKEIARLKEEVIATRQDKAVVDAARMLDKFTWRRWGNNARGLPRSESSFHAIADELEAAEGLEQEETR